MLITLLIACSSGKVITYAHSNANFDDYRTYRIRPHQEIAEISQQGYATYQRLDELVAAELESKGYRYHLEADLVVEYKISSGLSQDTRSNTYDRYSWYYPDYSFRGNARQQVEGMLEIVAKDSRSKKPAWTGSADLLLRGRGNEERIRLKIQELLGKFPPAKAD